MKAAIILYGTLASASFASAPQEQRVSPMSIAPKQMRAAFALKDSTKLWIEHLYSPSNKKLYERMRIY
jgi:hypothetical protein